MKLHDSSIEQLLVDSRTALINALKDDPGLAPLAIYGYSKEELQRGMQMVEELERLHVKMISEYSEKKNSTEVKHEAWDKAREVYM